MKSIITFFIVVLFCCRLTAQNYFEVVNVENKTAEQIYFKAKEWIALNFKSANDVTQLDDATNKKLICKGVSQVPCTVGKVATWYYFSFTLVIECRDGRYRQEILPNYYKTQAGEEYTIEKINELTTEQGVKDYYKSINMTAFATQKAIEQVMESNKELLTNTDAIVKDKLSSIKTYIAMDQRQNDW